MYERIKGLVHKISFDEFHLDMKGVFRDEAIEAIYDYYERVDHGADNLTTEYNPRYIASDWEEFESTYDAAMVYLENEVDMGDLNPDDSEEVLEALEHRCDVVIGLSSGGVVILSYETKRD